MIAFASSLDQGGPMAKSAEDCALLLDAMAGFDERDSTSLNTIEAQTPILTRFTEAYAAGSRASASVPLQGVRIGVPKEFFGAGLAADVANAVEAALKEFEKLGAIRVEISLPRTRLAIPAYYVIAPA